MHSFERKMFESLDAEKYRRGKIRNKGTPRFSMNALIGDRFLKFFIGRRLPRQMTDAAGEALTLPEYTAEKPAEQACPTGKGQPEEETNLENKQEGETN
jgi:hypothetical protein